MTEPTQETPPIVVCYRWTIGELLAAHRAHNSQSLAYKWGTGSVRLGIGFYFLLLIGTISLVMSITAREWLYGITILPLFYILFANFYNTWQLKRNFFKRPDQDSEIMVKISTDSLFMHTMHGDGTDLAPVWWTVRLGSERPFVLFGRSVA